MKPALHYFLATLAFNLHECATRRTCRCNASFGRIGFAMTFLVSIRLPKQKPQEYSSCIIRQLSKMDRYLNSEFYFLKYCLINQRTSKSN